MNLFTKQKQTHSIENVWLLKEKAGQGERDKLGVWD